MAEFLAFLSPDLSNEDRFPHLLKELRALSAEIVIQEARNLLLDQLRKTAILCLNESADNLLMWSYYANGHNGYAVVFDAKALPFGMAVRVTYARKHPRILLSRRDMSGISVDTLATKARVWRHEKEWRVVVPRRPVPSDLGFTSFDPAPSGGYYGTVKPEAILGVVIGQQLHDGPHGEAVIKELRSRSPHLEISLAAVDRRRFRIVLQRL